jgi:hypothetical protein
MWTTETDLLNAAELEQLQQDERDDYDAFQEWLATTEEGQSWADLCRPFGEARS